MSDADVVVLGAGGHAKVVVSTLRAAGYRVTGLFDDDSAKWGTKVAGVGVLGPLMDAVGQGVIGIGQNCMRRRIAESSRHMVWVTVVHPSAYVDPTARLGAGTVIFAGAVVQPDIVIGNHAIVNTGATVDHDCDIGDFVHVAPGCHLAGGVIAEEGVFAGLGSAVIPGIRLGAWSTLGAGSVVTRDVLPGATVVGVPARVLKS